jgi:DNA invertase Pin-like site-specific DNA recombinase
MKLRARNEIRERWEEKHAAQVVNILRHGACSRAKIAEKLGISNHSLESIMAEVNAHHYLHSWKEDGIAIYKLVERGS